MTDADFPSALRAGHRLNEYRIDRVLGQGGFGITYLATDTVLHRVVALKEYLPSEFAVRTQGATVSPRSRGQAESYRWGLDRFLDEARTLARFRHRSIVPVLRFFEANGTGYMVMEHEAGRPFAELIAGPGRLEPARVVTVLSGLLDGLELVHAAGFLHRDIKPANIIVRTDGSPVLIDFGAARQALRSSDRTLTSIVTPRYAPIEQYASDGKQGPATDIYALAAVMHHAISGAAPPEATARVRDDPYKPLVPDGRYSRRFIAAINAALSVFADSRPRTIQAWRELLELEDAVRVSAVVADASDPEAAPTRVLEESSRRVPVRLAAVQADDRIRPPEPAVTRRQIFSWRGLTGALGLIAAVVVSGVYVWPALRDEGPTQVATAPPPTTAPMPPPPPAAVPQPVTPPKVEPKSAPAPAARDSIDKVLPPVTQAPAGPAPVAPRGVTRQSTIDLSSATATRANAAAERAALAGQRARERAGEARIRAAEAAKADLPGAERVEFPDRSKYAGTVRDGRREGLGVVVLADGERQAGEWKADRLDGLATVRSTDGRGYEGEWSAGAPSGFGVFILKPGERHAGDVSGGKPEGFGVRSYERGGVPVTQSGEWRDGALVGVGVETLGSGERYEGEFAAGRRQGMGLLSLPDGTRFHGRFVGGERDGYGVEVAPNGTVTAGLWRKGVLERKED
ncbi:MAG: protein kinase [Alphaproteobacteria bacterium]|nr:protein kinase [Alphaproteobacteria bacterium]MCW5741710.1 protein kinase [Alphaproteobacteria bacterium]